MSRASYVWVVQHRTGDVTATFTVKHELERYLNLRADRDLVKVTRLPDGDPLIGGRVELNPHTLQPAI